MTIKENSSWRGFLFASKLDIAFLQKLKIELLELKNHIKTIIMTNRKKTKKNS